MAMRTGAPHDRERLRSGAPIPTCLTAEWYVRGVAWQRFAVFFARPDDRHGRPIHCHTQSSAGRNETATHFSSAWRKRAAGGYRAKCGPRKRDGCRVHENGAIRAVFARKLDGTITALTQKLILCCAYMFASQSSNGGPTIFIPWASNRCGSMTLASGLLVSSKKLSIFAAGVNTNNMRPGCSPI